MAFAPETALSYLRRADEQKRLAHAYLISGAPGSGKRTLASDLARMVHATEAPDIFAANDPGVFIAAPESKSRRIVIEQIRELEHTLQMRAADGRRKVAVIADADRLQPQAANAFLKTLEEPPQNSLLLLLSALPEALPDTILSRCISIPLAAPVAAGNSAEESAVLDLLEEDGNFENAGVQLPYRLAQGFQRILSAAREEIQAGTAAELKREEARYKNTTDGSWLDEREQHYKALNESLYLETRARLIEALLLWWSEVLRAKTGIVRRDLPRGRALIDAIAEKLSANEILRRIRRVEELRDHLGRNIQESLALEVAFLALFSF